MAEITINFDTLKYNLYEILNVAKDASDNKIKKAFRNLLLHFHPDKNNETEEEIFQHIIMANQILSNKEIRKKYDNFLNKTEETHDELKKNFNKNKSDTPITKDEAQIKFDYKIKELTKKHINEFEEIDTKKNYEKMLKARESPFNIVKEDIIDVSDFNNKFENKILNKNFGDQIIPINEDMKLSTFNINDNFTSLDVAFDNLYIDGGGISTSKYTSLDAAFKIQPVELNVKEVSVEDAIKNYKNETKRLTDSNLKFDTQLYNNW